MPSKEHLKHVCIATSNQDQEIEKGKAYITRLSDDDFQELMAGLNPESIREMPEENLRTFIRFACIGIVHCCLSLHDNEPLNG